MKYLNYIYINIKKIKNLNKFIDKNYFIYVGEK